MPHHLYYKLVGREVVPVENVRIWARIFETEDPHICDTMVGDVGISTIFLGLNHAFHPDSPPILFETMVFGGPMDHYMDRYSTYDEAVAGHNKVVDQVREAPEIIQRLTRLSVKGDKDGTE